MTNAVLRQIFDKTNGHCHFCGDPIKFKRQGWRKGKRGGYWEVDHVIQRGKGGGRSADNCLPACTQCNRLRWHRTGKALRKLLRFGLIAVRETRRRTELGKHLEQLACQRRRENERRRKETRR